MKYNRVHGEHVRLWLWFDVEKKENSNLYILEHRRITNPQLIPVGLQIRLNRKSHPSWVRGLKLLTSTELDCGLEVAPCMVDGLKQLRSLPFR